MRKLILVFIFLVSLTTCDDGDILDVEIDFEEDTFLTCGDLVFYKTKIDPPQSLSLQITSPATTLEDLIETDSDGNLLITEETFTISSTGNTFHYRSYNDNPENYFCNDIPPSNVQITSDEQSTSGTAIVSISLIEDDNDGVPAEMEDINGNGDLTDDDTDGDGLPNYLDEDDDGDNVLTITELIDIDLVDANGDGDFNDDVDGDVLTDMVDTDGDGIPNYLDKDDDGDGVNTIDEENAATQNENPADDDSTGTAPFLPDYLDNTVTAILPATAYRDHTIQQTFQVALAITGLNLSNITIIDPFSFGELEDDRLLKERTVEIDF